MGRQWITRKGNCILKRGNSYRKNEEISGWTAPINTRKLNWYVSTITYVFLNQKRVFSHTFYSRLIEKDMCDCQNISVKLPCIYLCLSFRDLFIFLVSFLFLFLCLCYLYFGAFHFHVVSYWIMNNLNITDISREFIELTDTSRCVSRPFAFTSTCLSLCPI